MLTPRVAVAHIGRDEVKGHILREVEEWLVEREGTGYLADRNSRLFHSQPSKTTTKKGKQNKNNHTDKFQRGYLVVVGKLNYVK